MGSRGVIEVGLTPQTDADDRAGAEEPAGVVSSQPSSRRAAQERARADDAPRGWRTVAAHPLARIVAAVVFSRILLTVALMQSAGAYQATELAKRPCWTIRDTWAHNWALRLWGNWDSGWYQGIARKGYPDGLNGDQRSWAFQPLYPYLIRALKPIFAGNGYLAGLAISAVCLVVACELVRRLALLDLDEAGSWRAVWFFLALPGSFLFSAALTESLFTVLALGAFLAARKQQWTIACACVGLVAITRSVGLLIAVPVALEYLAAHGWSWRRPVPRSALHPRLAAFLLAPAGLALWSWYVGARTGDPLHWQKVQFTVWGHQHSNPFGYLLEGVRTTLETPSGKASIAVLVTVVMLVASVAAVLTRSMRLSAFVFMLILILPPLTLGTLVWSGMIRFLAPAFPMALLLARVKNQNAVYGLLLGLAVLQGTFVSVWTTCSVYVVV